MGRCYVIPGFRGWLAGSENYWKTNRDSPYLWGISASSESRGTPKNVVCPHEIGGPPGNRTPNLRIKSPLLCLVELEAQFLC